MKRFLLIDDLRGVAATMVALSHLVWLLPEPLPQLEYGRIGVEVFFVISGFVIAYSLRNRSISSGFIGLFFVRRSIRLDAVYWAVIIAEIVVLFVLWAEPVPGWRDLLVNAVYMQDVLGHRSILFVAWTLCLELQFYMFFVTVLGLSQWMRERSSVWARWRLSAVMYSALVVLSVLVYTLASRGQDFSFRLSANGLFAGYWFMFFSGVVACWVYLGSVSHKVLWLYVGLVLVVYLGFGDPSLVPENDLSAIASLAVLVFIHVLSRTPVMDAGFGSRVISYLGRISYSLYLAHATVGVNFIYIVSERYGTGTRLMFVTAAAAFGLSVLSAHLLYVVVEAPALRLSKRVPREFAKRRGSGPDKSDSSNSELVISLIDESDAERPSLAVGSEASKQRGS